MLMSAGRAGRAGAAPSVLLVLLLDVGVLDEPVKAATPDAEDEAEAAAPAPARSHGLGGAALLAVDMLLRECSCLCQSAWTKEALASLRLKANGAAGRSCQSGLK